MGRRQGWNPRCSPIKVRLLDKNVDNHWNCARLGPGGPNIRYNIK